MDDVIYEDAAYFNTTNKSLTDQERMILKKGCFSDPDIRETCGQISHEEHD